MFAKLKKRIEEESQTELTKSYQTTSATSSPNSIRKIEGSNNFNRERRTSASSTDSRDSRPSAESSEDAIGVLRRKTEQVKRLETRLQEYYGALQQQLDVTSKLEAELEKQKLSAVASVEKIEKEYEVKIKALEEEKFELKKRLESANTLNNSIIEKQENIDELEGFQTQEMAKIKHLLLNCQQDLQSKEEKMKQFISELDETKSTVTRLESENKIFQDKLDKEEIEKGKLKENYEIFSKNAENLEKIKSNLSDQVAKLKEELEETSLKYYHTEEKLAEARDKNDFINHSHEVYVETTDKTIEEKSCLITHLEERIQTLEQRVADSNLNGDDQLNAVLTERNNLEKKLEESRQHLMDIKSTWSEKIMTLEKQISHLNKKTAEDSVEMQRLENIAESSQKDTTEKVAALSEELVKSKSEISELRSSLQQKEEFWTSEKITLENELQIVRSAKENSEKDFHVALEKVKGKVLVMEKKNNSDRDNYEKEIEKLAVMHREGREEIEHLRTANKESKDKELQKDKQIEELSKSLEDITSVKSDLEKAVQELESALQSAKADCGKLQTDLLEKEKECAEITKKLEDGNQVNEQINAKLKESQIEQIYLQSQLTETKKCLEATENDMQLLKEELLKNAELSQGAAEKSTKILELNKSVAALENELLDRNKTIKLQQQRLSDMKKTLQRELKMQAIEANNGEFFADSRTMGPSGTMAPKDASQADLMHRLQTLDTSEPMFEDINFQYLKHVILKFMTSREYEAQHLIKAISVLLHFTPEEEGLIRDTLEWKMSWFGSKPKPKFSAGQISKSISTAT